MTMTHSHRPKRHASDEPTRRHLDVASLVLLLIGIVFGVFSYWLIADRGLSALILIPAVVAATTGASHLTKREVRR